MPTRAKTTKRTTKKTTKAAKAGKAAKRPARNGARNGGNARKAEVALLGGEPMRSVTGQLVLGDAARALEWYKRVFGAKELSRNPMPNGKIMHAVLKLGDSAFMVADSNTPLPAELSGAFLHIQDKGIQGMWDRAVANGAKPVLPLANQFWGDKYGQLVDPFGQRWSLGWPAQMTAAEKARLQREAMAMMANA